MLRSHALCCAVGSAEDDGAADPACGHVERLRSRVHDVVDGLHRKVERHELAHRAQASKRGPDRNARKASLWVLLHWHDHDDAKVLMEGWMMRGK